MKQKRFLEVTGGDTDFLKDWIINPGYGKLTKEDFGSGKEWLPLIGVEYTDPKY